MDSNKFSDCIRGFFAGIIKFIYKFFADAVDLMYDVASLEFGLNDSAEKIASKLFNILIIYMIFKITLAFLNYLINPDSATDNSKGMQNVIKRIIISIFMLISINPIFSFLTDFQDDIINSDILTSIFGTTDKSNVLKLTTIYGDTQYAYGVQMNPECDSDKYVYTFSKGDHMSLLLLKPFIQPYTADEVGMEKYDQNISIMNEEYCGVTKSWMTSNELVNVSTGDKKNIKEGFRQSVPGPNSSEGFMYKKYYAGENTDGNNTYIYDFNYFMALICGVIGLFIVISFCFDIVIRGCTLFLLKVIAPIPIISYVSPQGKSSEMLGNWLKKLGTVWASLFIRIISLNIGILMIGIACDELSKTQGTGILQIIVVLGMLMFAKKIPQLLEELFPGLKLGNGFELNPFKRISKEALGGNMLLGAGAGLLGAGVAGATNGFQRTGQTLGNIRKANGVGAKLRAAGSGIGKTFGSTVAGATRAGINSFRRTSKDGRIFNGAWNGYQTSMYSKLLREDNLRKAGLENASFYERAKFAAGSLLADGARYVGVLNKGQREYLDAARMDNEIKRMENELSRAKLQLEEEKQVTLAPFQNYASYAQKIKDKIENNSRVKAAQRNLEDAQATGNIQAIKEARDLLEDTTKNVGQYLLGNDRETRLYASKLQELRNNYGELRKDDYDFMDSSGFFKASSISSAKAQVNITETEYADREKQFESQQQAIDSIKNSPEYFNTHNENTRAKLQNTIQLNNDVQQPAYKPSAGPAQETAFDRYVGGHPGGHNSDHGPGRQFPPPDNGGNPRP